VQISKRDNEIRLLRLTGILGRLGVQTQITTARHNGKIYTDESESQARRDAILSQCAPGRTAAGEGFHSYE
jgi:hypothetical protein